MLTQASGFLFVQQHLARLDNIEVEEIKQSRIHDLHGVRRFTVSFDARQPLHSPNEFAVSGGIIGAPTAAEAALPTLQIVALEASERRITGRKWSASFRNAYARVHETRVVVFRVIIGRRIEGPGNRKHHHTEEQHQKRSLHNVFRFYWSSIVPDAIQIRQRHRSLPPFRGPTE